MLDAVEVSGVIAVVTYGLYGCATAKWHMSARVVETGIFDNFWDTVGFGVNGLVFFFAGASSVNFFWRSSEACAPRLIAGRFCSIAAGSISTRILDSIASR